MYIIGFIKSLAKPRNWLAVLYLFANAVIVFFLFGVMLPLPSNAIIGVSREFWVNGAIGLAINTIVLLFALSPLGESYLRYQCKMKRLVENEATKFIYDLFYEVYAQALLVNPRLSKKIKLFFDDTEDTNAFALGHRSIAITKGLLTLDDEHIKGILAHEFGHLDHNDCDIKLGINVSNSILIVFLGIIRLVVNFFSFMLAMVDNRYLSVFAISFRTVLDIALLLLFKGWSMLGNLLVNATSRKCEFVADEFACKCGYAVDLMDGLTAIDPSRCRSSVLALIGSTHPDTYKRVERIQTFIANNIEDIITSTDTTAANDSIAACDGIAANYSIAANTDESIQVADLTDPYDDMI